MMSMYETEMTERPWTPYPIDLTNPGERENIFVLPSGQEAVWGYIPTAPNYEPTTNIRRTNTAPVNPPNLRNPGPGTGAVNQQPNVPNVWKEVWMNMPLEFDGDWKKYKKFRQAIVLYLGINGHIYDDDEAKIGFTLQAYDPSLCDGVRFAHPPATLWIFSLLGALPPGPRLCLSPHC